MRRDIQLNLPQTGMPDLCPTVLPVHLPPLAVGSVSPAVYPALHVIYCAGNGWTRLVSGQRRDVNSRGCLVQSRRRAIQTQQRPIRTRRQLIQTRGRDIRTQRRLVRSQRSTFSGQQTDISSRRNSLNHNAFSAATGQTLPIQRSVFSVLPSSLKSVLLTPNPIPPTLVLRREAASTRLPALNSQPSTLNSVPSNA